MIDGIEINALKGLTQDSRNVGPGYLFAALEGAHVDGRAYIGEAIQKGASVILARTGTQIPEEAQNVTVITDENPRRVFAHMAAEFYGAQPENIVAVTGTNGKTSVVNFAQQLWTSQGLSAASIGTLSGHLTTPDPVALHAHLSALKKSGVTHVAMEASSHGLDQCRLDGVKIKAAGFTNLSRDHLDYHGDMESYFKAKARLFSDLLLPDGAAVLNADCPEFAPLESVGEGGAVISYGFAAGDLKIVALEPFPSGQKVTLEVFGQSYELTISLVGAFQIMNALCALGLVLSGDRASQEPYVQALERLKAVPGRLQSVAGHPKGAAIYVDYAHTPDALLHALQALRPHTDGRLVCVFGCGGDRDRGKRPLMGQVAAGNADQVIVTDDNPRSENPADIRKDILKGAPEAQEVSGRFEAICAAVKNLDKGDVLLIAGKGHEQGQIFADHTEPFDDVQKTKKAIEEL